MPGYDNAFGDLFQTILPEGNVIEYGYDHAGHLTSVERKGDIDPAIHGERTVYELDGASGTADDGADDDERQQADELAPGGHEHGGQPVEERGPRVGRHGQILAPA